MVSPGVTSDLCLSSKCFWNFLLNIEVLSVSLMAGGMLFQHFAARWLKLDSDFVVLCVDVRISRLAALLVWCWCILVVDCWHWLTSSSGPFPCRSLCVSTPRWTSLFLSSVIILSLDKALVALSLFFKPRRDFAAKFPVFWRSSACFLLVPPHTTSQ